MGVGSFNPSLVRLAPKPFKTSPARSPNFQSQLGSIGAWSIRGSTSIHGSLSIPAWFDWRPDAVVAGSRQFAHPFNPSLVRLARCHVLAERGSVVAFNPSLVRLALIRLHRICRDLTAFNPSLVRLAPLRPHQAGESGGRFQSQLGSIGAEISGGCPHFDEYLSIPAWFDWRSFHLVGYEIVDRAFNPSLVRLARHRHQPLRPADQTFNPSLVRLAHRHHPWRPTGPQAFNPSLVRLARDDCRPRLRRRLAFNPSLVRLAQAICGGYNSRHSRLSIPAWFDWRP